MLSEIEKIVLNGLNLAHSIARMHFDEGANSLRITVTPDTQAEYNKVFRSYIFEAVKNFRYELDPNENFDDWPRSIIGIDYYPGRSAEGWNTVINCGDIEFTFFSPALPRFVEENQS